MSHTKQLFEAVTTEKIPTYQSHYGKVHLDGHTFYETGINSSI